MTSSNHNSTLDMLDEEGSDDNMEVEDDPLPEDEQISSHLGRSSSSTKTSSYKPITNGHSQLEDSSGSEDFDDEKVVSKKAIKLQAPGLNVFQNPCLNTFSSKDLNLEKDFGYDKRNRLIELGLQTKLVERIFSDHFTFVNYLAPEASSVMVANETEFAQICDYLFFWCCSHNDDDESLNFAIMKKALFDLLKNYAYKWKMDLARVFTVLRNLGALEEAIGDEKYLREGSLERRLEVIQKQRNEKLQEDTAQSMPVVVPKSHEFYIKREHESFKTNIELDAETKTRVIQQALDLIVEIFVTFHSNSVFRPKSDDYISSLVLVYLIGLVASDRLMINNSFTWKTVVTYYQFQFDCFSPKKWSGKDSDEEQYTEDLNACIDVALAFADVSYLPAIQKISTWTPEELPSMPHFENMDHHHNMVRRLQFLPLSLRGQQIRKIVAMLSLQTLLNARTPTICLVEEVSGLTDSLFSLIEIPNRIISDAVATLQENMTTFTMLKLEHYAMVSILKMLEFIVGNEAIDFDRKKVDSIVSLQSILEEYSSKIRESIQDPNGCRVKEVVTQIKTKWQIMRGRYSSLLESASKYERGNMKKRQCD